MEIKLSDIKNQILEGIDIASTCVKSPVLFISEPGLGKTTTIKNYCEEKNYPLVTLLTSQYSPEDVAGFPVRDRNKIIKLDPDWLDGIKKHYKENSDTPLVLFLDEITTASRATQGAILSLIFDRRVNDYIFPDNLIILSAGNRPIDLLEESEILIDPVKTRFAIIELNPKLDDYISFVDLSSNDKKFIELLKNIITELYLSRDIKDDYNPRSVKNSFSGRGIFYLTSYLSKNKKEITFDILKKYCLYYLGINIEENESLYTLIVNYNYDLNIDKVDLEIYKKSMNKNDFFEAYDIKLEGEFFLKIDSLQTNLDYISVHYEECQGTKNNLKEAIIFLCEELNVTEDELLNGVSFDKQEDMDKVISYLETKNVRYYYKSLLKSKQEDIDEIEEKWQKFKELESKGQF